MARHFFSLYLLIVLTLAAVSWGQDKLLQAYSVRDLSNDRASAAALAAVESRLQSAPPNEWRALIDMLSNKTGGAFELFATEDVVGSGAVKALGEGRIAFMQSAADELWALKAVNRDYVLAFKARPPVARRGPLEWTITLVFYAVMALVIMIWIWPLTRDLRALQASTARFGYKNWRFDARIKPRSPIYALAETFRTMAARIDGLIASHQDMSNAVSHEIKTPLARMLFEIELAQHADSVAQVKSALCHIRADITAISDLVKATLNYAILERADLALNLGTHDFTTLLPAIAAAVRNEAGPDLQIETKLSGQTDAVCCDLHLIDTAVKNLLYNAARHARREVILTFKAHDGVYQLRVDDDGPGIPEKDRKRVFDSFVQLESAEKNTKGYGLGLAIVKRAIEWHHGGVVVETSPLGGARISVEWPSKRR